MKKMKMIMKAKDKLKCNHIVVKSVLLKILDISNISQNKIHNCNKKAI